MWDGVARCADKEVFPSFRRTFFRGRPTYWEGLCSVSSEDQRGVFDSQKKNLD